MSAADCDIMVSLNENHSPTDQFVQAIRAVCRTIFPMLVSGSRRRISSPKPSTLGCFALIDIQITGANLTAQFNFATKLMQQIRHISGAVDFRIQEPNNVPQLNITIDRSMASILGITAQSVTQSVLGACPDRNRLRQTSGWTQGIELVTSSTLRSRNTICILRRSAKLTYPRRSGTRPDSG